MLPTSESYGNRYSLQAENCGEARYLDKLDPRELLAIEYTRQVDMIGAYPNQAIRHTSDHGMVGTWAMLGT